MHDRGSGRRFCERCQRDVHDLIQRTERDAQHVPPGACVRSTTGPRGRPLFADSLIAAPVVAGVFLLGCAHTSVGIDDSRPVVVVGNSPVPAVPVAAPPVEASHATPSTAAVAAECDPPQDRVVVVTMGVTTTIEGVFFASGEVAISPAAAGLLDEVAAVLQANPQVTALRVLGHTDDRGSPESNERVSKARAVAVVEYLVNKGIEADRLVAVGKGDAYPLSSNATPEGRARNRRVEFEIVD